MISGRLPRYAPLPRPADGPRWGALTDRPFVVYAVHNALMSMQFLFMLGLCLTFGTAGWFGLGGFFALLGLTAPGEHLVSWSW